MNETALIERATTSEVIGAFYDVYNTLGFGFLEFVYSLALERELVRRGRSVEREVPIPLHYRGELLTAYRLDMLVDQKVIVEIKSTHALPSSTQRQTLNYLRATDLEVALILHFGPKPEFIRLVHSKRIL